MSVRHADMVAYVATAAAIREDYPYAVLLFRGGIQVSISDYFRSGQSAAAFARSVVLTQFWDRACPVFKQEDNDFVLLDRVTLQPLSPTADAESAAVFMADQ